MNGRLCIDTNLLVLLVIGRLRPDLVGRHRRLRAYDARDLAALEGVLRDRDAIVLEAVLAETSNLVGTGLDGAMTGLAAFVRKTEIVRVEPHEVARQAMFARFGYTDTALAMVSGRGAAILTDDRPLAGRLASRDLPVINFNTLRTGR